MQIDIDAAIADIAAPEVPLTYYHELDNTYFSVNSNTFIAQVYATVRHAQHRRHGRVDHAATRS